jgi:hypothetical protein
MTLDRLLFPEDGWPTIYGGFPLHVDPIHLIAVVWLPHKYISHRDSMIV